MTGGYTPRYKQYVLSNDLVPIIFIFQPMNQYWTINNLNLVFIVFFSAAIIILLFIMKQHF